MLQSIRAAILRNSALAPRRRVRWIFNETVFSVALHKANVIYLKSAAVVVARATASRPPLTTAVDHRPNAKIKRNVPALMANVQVQHQRAAAFNAVHSRRLIRRARCDKYAVALEAVALVAFAQRILV